jgi:hypothetical protein
MIIDLTGFDDDVGFCDRFWQVSFCAALAYLRQDETLFFRESPPKGIQSRIADIMEIQGFEIKTWNKSSGSAEYRLNSFNSAPSLQRVKQLKPPDLRINDKSFLELWLSTYKSFSPRKDIREKIENIGVDKECIGLHIRYTDKINENPSPWDIHPRELEQMKKRTAYAIQAALKNNRLKKVYLATDCSKARLEWGKKLDSLGATVLLNPYAAYDEKQFRQTSSEDFFIDLFSLARCRQIVGLVNSGVPWTASKIGGINGNEIIWGRYATRLNIVVRELRKKSRFANLLIIGANRLKTIIVKS